MFNLASSFGEEFYELSGLSIWIDKDTVLRSKYVTNYSRTEGYILFSQKPEDKVTITNSIADGIKTENEIKEIAETSKDYYLGKVQCNDTYTNEKYADYWYPTFVARYGSNSTNVYYCFWMSNSKLENPFILEIPKINYPSAITFRPNVRDLSDGYKNTNFCNFQLYFNGNKKYECDIGDKTVANPPIVYKVMINAETNSYQISNTRPSYTSPLSEDNVYPFSE